MAGLGFKDFAVGEVLTSANVDGYLMQQTVMRFADSAARGSALGTATGTAVALAEGMVSYLDDVNRVEFYNGSLWVPPGAVRQIVTSTDGTDRTTTSSSFADANISVSITPISSDSTLYVMWNAVFYTQRGNDLSRAYFSITDSSNTPLTGAEAANEVIYAWAQGVANIRWQGPGQIIGTVAATDTSTRTYKGRFASTGSETAGLRNSANTGRLTVWEVAA